MNKQVFQIDLNQIIKTKSPKLFKWLPKCLIKRLSKTIHLDEINEILRINADKEGVAFMEGTVKYFDIKPNIIGLDKIEKDKRYIFASNHPLGGLDGICLSAIIGEKFDGKIKYIVNDLLYFIKNLRPIFIPINKHGAQQKENTRLTNEAFESDNQIITFPAGLCSRKIKGEILDLEWKKSFIQKSITYERDIVPIYFDAKNSSFFYRLANIRKRLGFKFNIEMLYLPDEMFKNKGETFTIVFGEPISFKNLDKSKSFTEWAELIKEEAYSLKSLIK